MREKVMPWIKASGLVLLAAVLFLVGMCGCSSENTDSVVYTDPSEAWVSNVGDYEPTESDLSFAESTANRLVSEVSEVSVPADPNDLNMTMYVANDGRKMFDCLVFSEDNEHVLFMAFDNKGEIQAKDLDQQILVDYTSEYIKALGNGVPISLTFE